MLQPGPETSRQYLPDVLLETRSGEFLIDAASGGITTLIEIAALIYGCSIREEVKGKRFVVVYDEPENHLHPELQRALFQNLTDAFPLVQFIVATHSPFIGDIEHITPKNNHPESGRRFSNAGKIK